jgi:KDO2-lipid IV(A) lauroyltransferase
MPPRIGYWFARRVGVLLYRLSPGLTSVLSHNIRHVLGLDTDEEEVQALVRQACVNVVKGHYDLLRVNRLTVEEIKEMVDVEGLEIVERALAFGQGVVAISAHLGNVDLVGQLPLAYGIPITGAVLHIQPERLFRYLLELRTSHGLRLIPSDEPMLELFRALKRGEIIALPCDRELGDHVRPVEFFGSLANLPDGPVRVAMRTGAALIPVFTVRRPDETFLIQVEPPLEMPRTGDLEADVAATMKMVVQVMERYISRHPEQWLVATPVWPMD